MVSIPIVVNVGCCRIDIYQSWGRMNKCTYWDFDISDLRRRGLWNIIDIEWTLRFQYPWNWLLFDFNLNMCICKMAHSFQLVSREMVWRNDLSKWTAISNNPTSSEHHTFNLEAFPNLFTWISLTPIKSRMHPWNRTESLALPFPFLTCSTKQLWCSSKSKGCIWVPESTS